MATTSGAFETGHQDVVHDMQFDYYGKRLATCSSDRTIKVFDVAGDTYTPLAELAGHEGPVWQVVWAHPKFGSLIASCSFDHKVIIWKEVQENSWAQLYNAQVHSTSINSLSFAPHELGLVLACASSDGSLSVLTSQPEGSWNVEKIEQAHSIGCNALSWAPATPVGSLVSAKGPGQAVKRLVSCGCDNLVKIWVYNDKDRKWQQDGESLREHSDWVRDVAWAPNLGLPFSTIASAGQEGKVVIWSESQKTGWSKTLVHDFKSPVWRVSWSVTGGILAVSDSKGGVTLWKESLDGEWQQISG